MKKIFKNTKFIIISIVFTVLAFANTEKASAVFIFTSYDIDYQVVAGNIPPVADAGADQSLTVPTSMTTIDGSGSYDPDGVITTYVWTRTLGSGNITSPNTPITGITGLTSGTSTFCLTVIDNGTPILGNADCMNVVVSAATNIPPTAYAGADQNIIVPQSATSVSGSGFDQDGVIVSYAWSQLSGPMPTVITNPNVAGTTITGMTAIGVYTFQLIVCDDDAACDDDSMTIIVSTSPPPNLTANLWANPNVFPSSGGTTTLTWSSNGTSCTSTDFATLNAPINTFPGVNDAVTVTKTYRISCTDGINFANADATVTVNSKDDYINGACSVPERHFLCAAGTSSNNAGTGPWTWDCLGSGGGSDDSCSEAAGGGGGGDPQCSDGIDNADIEDILWDASDPGCWTDVKDPGTYDPFDDDERNSPKIKVIEI